MTSQELQILENFERDSEWFNKNITKLRGGGFTGKFVAIKNSKLLTSGKDMDIVLEELEKKRENPSFVFIEFVYPEGYTLIL